MKYFGTDGIRGEYGGAVMNEAFAARLGAAVAAWARGSLAASRSPLPALIGRDTRASGAELARALADGLMAGGMEPRSLGVLPTPAVARAVRMQKAALGVVITASHNPASDNGIKFFKGDGSKLSAAEEKTIEALMGHAEARGPLRNLNASAPSAPPRDQNAVDEYVAAAAALLPAKSLKGWKIVLDTANGATCGTSPEVLRRLGAEVVGIGAVPDGRNINAGVGSEHPEAMCARVRAESARLGVAHDGDGDRCILCDERGEVLDGDEILAILATHALARGALAARTLVVTVQSNLGVDAAVAAAGGRVLRTAVGDRNVAERMVAKGAMLGGESSGHIICAEVSPTGDGLVAALKVIEVMNATGKPLSELRRGLTKFPQRSIALKVKEKKPLETLGTLTKAIAALEQEMGARGRVLVRYSGTEAKLRLLVEGPTEAIVTEAMRKLESAARTDLDVQ